MNSKRKADLQRKLALAPVPRPPAGLAERIKNDIPDYLKPDAERRRVASTLSFNLRVAAALLVVLSSVLAAVYLLEPEDQMRSIAAVDRQGPTQVFAEREAAAATDEVRVEITQAAPAATPAANQPAQPAALQLARAADRAEPPKEEVDAGLAGGTVAVAELAPPPPPPVATAPPPAEAAPAAAPIAQSAAEATAAESAAESVADSAAEPQRAKVASLVREAYAADVDLRRRGNSVFGISVDPAVFHNIKATLEQNQRPSASAVNLEAIVNYFAGAPPKPPRSGVKLEAEGSPSPVEPIGQRGFLRFSIDTAAGESTLPVGSNAKLEIDFNSNVVEQATPVGDSPVTGPESALLNNLSVTGLYELTLKANRRTSDRVATVRLTYDSVTDGRKRTIERTVYARDFAKLWTRASRRHRLASLGAVWGQSLQVTAAPAPEVAKRAEELATQNPRDERAQELATAATASSKLVNSSGF